MGYGMPAAMGAKVALPNEEVICISGDASFQMNLQELATLAQYKINAKTIIINNGWLGMVRQWQEAFYGERYSSTDIELGMPDFELLAKAFGIKGLVIRNREELPKVIAEMLAHDGPVLVDAHVTRDENCYPMVAPGSSVSQMLGLPEKAKTELAVEIINCPKCEAKNPSNHHFCSECGTKL
jgi:acetolactate synthase-1/2/3 large subunit